MREPILISEPKLLVVEGKDDEEFFKALLGKMDLANVQVQKPSDTTDMGELWRFLKSVRAALNSAHEIDPQSFVSDAEGDSFQNVRKTLHTFSEEMGLANVQVQDFGGVDELRDFLKALQMQDEFAMVDSLGIVRDAEEHDPMDAFASVCGALRGADLTPPNEIAAFEGTNPRVGIFILPDGAEPGMLEDLCLRSIADQPVIRCIDEYFECVKEQLESLPKNMAKARTQTFVASTPEPVSLLRWAFHRDYWPWDHPAFNQIKRSVKEMVKEKDV